MVYAFVHLASSPAKYFPITGAEIRVRRYINLRSPMLYGTAWQFCIL